VQVIREVRAMRAAVSRWSAGRQSVALVPTMGNLHRGHLALVARARREARRVVVSIFVNPTQFGPHEDFAAYPRTLAADSRALAESGADAIFVPSVRTMYPAGAAVSTRVTVPGLSTELCGAFRPGHFDGVCSVVLRLFTIVAPAVAVFGEKDYQQLTILRRMASELHLPLRLVGVPTVREADGLALSSRNQYLTAGEREQAPQLQAILRRIAAEIRGGRSDFGLLERTAMRQLAAAGFRPDYVALRSAATLGPPADADRRLRVLAAAWLGRARLIDNLPALRPAR
jgi:pantoate--beta-alanine ligase